jgi:RNA polymerase sigma-70 factor (ECF subfamily)
MPQYDVENFNGENNTEEFLRLLVPIQGKLYAYILSRWPNRIDADDIMQETVATIWKKFNSYESGTDFQAWAITIAKFNVMSFRKKNKNNLIQFNDEVMQVLDCQTNNFFKLLDNRLSALSNCVKKLNKEDKKMLEMKYLNEFPVKYIANRFDITSRAVYKSLSRIHNALMQCIRRSLTEEVVNE